MALQKSTKTLLIAAVVLTAIVASAAFAEEPQTANPFQRFSQSAKNFFTKKPAAKQPAAKKQPAPPSRRSTVMNWFRRPAGKPPRTAYQFWSEERPNEEQTVRR